MPVRVVDASALGALVFGEPRAEDVARRLAAGAPTPRRPGNPGRTPGARRLPLTRRDRTFSGAGLSISPSGQDFTRPPPTARSTQQMR